MAGRSDTELLEDLLARENRLVSAYGAALRRDAIEVALGELLLEHEREHARAIEQSLGQGADRNPRASVPSSELTAAVRDRESFARFAIELEDHTIAAYAESIPRIRDAKLRQPLGSIMACEAAHEVALRDALGERSLVN